MKTYNIELRFTSPYVAHPYTVEQYQLIEITKLSGMNRTRSTGNKNKALEEYLRQNNLTLADYEDIVKKAGRDFHQVEDTGEIYIPGENVLSFLVGITHELRSASKPCQPDQVRSRFIATDFMTGKFKPDRIWERFVTVTAGTGQKLSNQRALRKNGEIEGFTATGQISFDPEFVKPDVLKNAFIYGGLNVGIGASRKMGKGRFALDCFEAV